MTVNYGKPTRLDDYFKEHGYPSRNDSDEYRLKLMRGAPKQAKKKSKYNGKTPPPA